MKRRNKNYLRWVRTLLCTGLAAVPALLLSVKAEDVQLGSFYFSLPEEFSYQQDSGLILKNGEQVGTVKAYPLPENIEEGIGWQRELDLPEWQDESLGYFGDNTSLEFFSDVPPEQEHTVMTLHSFFWDDRTLYDLCLDELKVEDGQRQKILATAAVGEQKTPLPYEFDDLPEGITVIYEDDGVKFVDGTRIVGGVTAYPIPEGVYDPYDKWFSWLADVGIPDYSDGSLTLDNAISDFRGGWRAEFRNADGDASLCRSHHFTVRDSIVYDVWMDKGLLGEENATALSDAVHYLAPQVQHKTVTVYPEGVETTCQLEELVRPGYTVWLPEEGWPFGDREIEKGVPMDILTYGLNDAISLRIVTLAGKNLSAAQSWVRENWPQYDLIEDKRGGLGGLDAQQNMLDVALYPAENVTYAVIRMYPLEAAEGGGMWLNVFADTFQLREDAAMSTEEMDYLRCLEVMEQAKFEEDNALCIENSVWMKGDDPEDGAYTRNLYYWDGENSLVKTDNIRSLQQEAVLYAHEALFCYTEPMTSDTQPCWKPCQEEHEIVEPLMSSVTFNKHYFRYAGNGNDAQGRGHRVSYEWLTYDDEGNASVYATVDFIFDDDGKFLMVQWKNGAAAESEFNVVESLASTQPDAVRAEIEEAYQTAVAQTADAN